MRGSSWVSGNSEGVVASAEQCVTGVLHLDGKLLPKSEEQAFELFELGAAGGESHMPRWSAPR
jgi:hypothetical protein